MVAKDVDIVLYEHSCVSLLASSMWVMFLLVSFFPHFFLFGFEFIAGGIARIRSYIPLLGKLNSSKLANRLWLSYFTSSCI